MKPENPNPAQQAGQPAVAGASPVAGGDGKPPADGGLSTPAQIEQLADQLTACADALHERIMRDIQAYHGGPVPAKAQQAARQLLDDEQVLRQRANGLYADAATIIVHSLGKSQQHIVALTMDAAEKLKKLTKLADAMGIVGRVLELSGAALTGNPVFIMRALEDMKHMLDLVALHSAPPPKPAD
jgi:hypothetical protein